MGITVDNRIIFSLSQSTFQDSGIAMKSSEPYLHFGKVGMFSLNSRIRVGLRASPKVLMAR